VAEDNFRRKKVGVELHTEEVEADHMQAWHHKLGVEPHKVAEIHKGAEKNKEVEKNKGVESHNQVEHRTEVETRTETVHIFVALELHIVRQLEVRMH